MLNESALGRKRVTKKLDETVIKFFDWLAEAIEPDFVLPLKLDGDHELRLEKDHLDDKIYWFLDGRYINAPVPLGKELDIATPMRRRITREQILWITEHLQEILDKIQSKVSEDTTKAMKELAKITRGMQNGN